MFAKFKLSKMLHWPGGRLWLILFGITSGFGPCLAQESQESVIEPANSIDGVNFSSDDIEFFEKQIRPLLIEHCYECHSGSERNGGLSVETREQLLAGGDTGPAVLPGDASRSLMIAAVNYQNDYLQMPPSGVLSDAQIAAFTSWINRGAPDPRASVSDDSLIAEDLKRPSGMSIEEGREFWAFRPVGDHSLPSVQAVDWLKSPIDRFVLGRLEQKGLAPAPPADRRMLIRRVYLNLIGLPPTPEEVERFVWDPSPDAFEKLVERLLMSPQYGVRWGRHWLDVARYADSNGLDENIAYGNAWRYRDYVIQAFNRDKPYNRFVTEQIAGDLLPEANAETQTATGFLALGAKVLAEPDMDKLLMDTIDEQIDTTGKAFLGLSLGCARCHDHKFDPLSQRDYYALAAIFKGTRTFSEQRYGAIKFWYEHDQSDEKERELIEKVDAKVAAAKAAAGNYKSQAMSAIRIRAQQQAADYLMAVTQFDLNATLVDVAEVAESLGLHPRVLYHCRRHVENQKESPFFTDWHRLKTNPAAVRQHYSDLFSRVDTALEEARKIDPKTNNLSDSQLETARVEVNDPSGFLVVPPQPEYAFDSETLKEYYRLMEEARLSESNAADLSAAMGVAEATPTAWLPIHIRGSHLNLGSTVDRGFPEVMQATSGTPIFPDHQSGRLELAEWLTSTANPLTARVLVNRVWGWHFGKPLVATTENFGVTGQTPSHPELLDWLARRFMQSGWSIKHLHRLILNSSTYQMASEHPETGRCESTDPENVLLWKFRIRRLDAEQLRDSILVVSGLIENRLDGKSVPLRNKQFVFDHTSIDYTRYDSLRRTAYLPVIRNNLYTLLEQFDFPDPTMPTGHRQTTTVAPQSLLLLNADIGLNAAGELATRLLKSTPETTRRLDHLFTLLLARPPSESERQRCLSFLAEVSSDTPDQSCSERVTEQDAWALVAQAAMATNDFLYVR